MTAFAFFLKALRPALIFCSRFLIASTDDLSPIAVFQSQFLQGGLIGLEFLDGIKILFHQSLGARAPEVAHTSIDASAGEGKREFLFIGVFTNLDFIDFFQNIGRNPFPPPR